MGKQNPEDPPTLPSTFFNSQSSPAEQVLPTASILSRDPSATDLLSQKERDAEKSHLNQLESRFTPPTLQRNNADAGLLFRTPLAATSASANHQQEATIDSQGWESYSPQGQ